MKGLRKNPGFVQLFVHPHPQRMRNCQGELIFKQPASHIRSSPTGEVVPTPSVLEHALSGKPAEAAAQSLSPQPSVQSISPQPSVQPLTHQPSVQPLSQLSQPAPPGQSPQTTPAGAEASGAEEKKDSGLKKNVSRKL